MKDADKDIIEAIKVRFKHIWLWECLEDNNNNICVGENSENIVDNCVIIQFNTYLVTVRIPLFLSSCPKSNILDVNEWEIKVSLSTKFKKKSLNLKTKLCFGWNAINFIPTVSFTCFPSFSLLYCNFCICSRKRSAC